MTSDYTKKSLVQDQMDMFSVLDLPTNQQPDYSNVVDIYDAIPKYVWGKTREHEDLKSASIVRNFKIRNRNFIVKLKPAIIEKGDKTVLIYAGQREELVEDALRKIAVNGGGVCVKEKAGVSFTLYELMKELERMGHTFSLDEIKEALFVCRGAIMECYSEDGESVINSSLFGLLGLTTRKDIVKKGRAAKCYVQFNPLVNQSIMDLTFRQYNYHTGMKIRSPLARFFYKRMAQYWTHASKKDPYTPKLTTFLGQTPRGLTNKMGEDLRAMRNALDALKKHNVISHYEEEKELKGKQKVINAQYKIFPHPEFVNQVISANQRNKAMNKKLLTKTGDNPGET